MRAERLLVALWSCNDATIFVRGDRLRVEAPRGVLTPSIRGDLARHKADVLRLLASINEYRVLLHSDIEDLIFLDAQARFIDELGPALATVVRQTEARGAAAGVRHA